MNLLFTCAGRRKYLVDYFKDEILNFGHGVIVGTDMSENAPALSSCDIRYKVPSVYDENYIDELLKVCKKNNINALLSLSDLELPILSANKNKFEDIGVQVVVSDMSVIDICSDKWKTFQFALEHNIPTPKTYLDILSVVHDLQYEQLSFPLIVKPRWGSASFGLFVVNTIEDLKERFEQCFHDIKKSHISQFALDDACVIVQEFIQGKEYGLDIFNDLNGDYRGVICKEKLSMRAGETEKSLSVSSDKFEKYVSKISEQLRHVGNLDTDFLENDKGLYLLELNPRFGGGYPFSHNSGGNLVKALLQSLEGCNNAIEINYQTGKVFAKCDEIVEVGNFLIEKDL
jgi:carbamoyl-phosphate synthase large subunit